MSANMQSIQLSMVWTFFLILIKYTAINAPPPTTSSLWSFARSAQTFPPVFSFFHTILCQHRDSPFSGNRVTIGLQIGRLKRYPVAGSLLSCERSFELRTTIPMQSSVNKHKKFSALWKSRLCIYKKCDNSHLMLSLYIELQQVVFWPRRFSRSSTSLVQWIVFLELTINWHLVIVISGSDQCLNS